MKNIYNTSEGSSRGLRSWWVQNMKYCGYGIMLQSVPCTSIHELSILKVIGTKAIITVQVEPILDEQSVQIFSPAIHKPLLASEP